MSSRATLPLRTGHLDPSEPCGMELSAIAAAAAIRRLRPRQWPHVLAWQAAAAHTRANDYRTHLTCGCGTRKPAVEMHHILGCTNEPHEHINVRRMFASVYSHSYLTH